MAVEINTKCQLLPSLLEHVDYKKNMNEIAIFIGFDTRRPGDVKGIFVTFENVAICTLISLTS